MSPTHWQDVTLHQCFFSLTLNSAAPPLRAERRERDSTMSPVLPFDIITLIIDIVAENEDTDLLKELALVSRAFLQPCCKHLFATIELSSGDPELETA